MSKFNVRPISVAVAVAPAPPSDKKPSAYSAMKHGSPAHSVSAVAAMDDEEVGGRKRGRPSKDELRRRRLDMAHATIQVLMVAKPNRAKIREYIQNRIMGLDEEKR
jgi:hypothetical protein